MLRGIPPRYRRAPNESRLLSGFPTGGIPSSLSSPVYQALSATNNGTIVIQDSTPDNIAYVGPMLLPLYGGIFGHPRRRHAAVHPRLKGESRPVYLRGNPGRVTVNPTGPAGSGARQNRVAWSICSRQGGNGCPHLPACGIPEQLLLGIEIEVHDIAEIAPAGPGPPG